MAYLIGIDLGTSATKTVLFDESGKAISSCSVEYDFMQPQNGWAEQRPLLWWDAAVETIKNVLKESRVDPAEIKGVGVAGQMHGLVMLDEYGNVLRDAIIWCDGRTTKQCEEIEALIGRERLVDITANPALPGFTASKIMWVRENEPEIYNRCRKILLPKDYITFKLTGVYGQEVSDASGTNLLNIRTRDWSDEILDKLEIDRSLFPDVRESTEIAGHISKEASFLTGLLQSTVVCMGAGDNAAAAIGTGVVSEGKALTSLGTSGVIFAHSDRVVIDNACRVHTFCHAIPGAWAVMSCTLSAGMSLKWFRDNFCAEEMDMARSLNVSTYDLMTKNAKSIPIGSDKLFFLPYLMGERSPILDEKARGAFLGISAYHTKAHFIRSVMEGVIFSQRQCLDVFHEMGIAPQIMYACGGGARSPFWRQMLSDLYDMPITTLANEEGPALGAAILAGVACGIFSSVIDACHEMIHTTSQISPLNPKEYEPYYQVFSDLYKSLESDFRKIHAL